METAYNDIGAEDRSTVSRSVIEPASKLRGQLRHDGKGAATRMGPTVIATTLGY